MDTEEALRRLHAQTLPVRTTFESRFETPYPVPVLLSGELAPEEALRLWRALKEREATTGLVPLVIGPEPLPMLGVMEEAPVEEHQQRLHRDLERLKQTRAEALFQQWEARVGVTREQLAGAAVEQLEGEALEPGRRHAPEFLREPGPVSLLLAGGTPELVPVHLNLGGWNECPAPEVHAAVLEHFRSRYGAELLYVGRDSLELDIARPPLAPGDIGRALWEQTFYSRAELPGPDFIEPVHATRATWFFTWS